MSNCPFCGGFLYDIQQNEGTSHIPDILRARLDVAEEYIEAQQDVLECGYLRAPCSDIGIYPPNEDEQRALNALDKAREAWERAKKKATTE